MKGMDIHSINPYIRVAMHSVLKAGTTIRRRIIFDYELIYLEKGSMTFWYADASYICHAGQFILIRPGIAHSFEDIRDEISQPHIHFDMTYNVNSKRTPVSFQDLPAMSAEKRMLIQEDVFSAYPPLPFVCFKDKEKALDLFYRIINQSGSNNACLLAKGLLTELIHMLLCDQFPALHSTVQEEKYSVSCQIKDFIDSGQCMSADLDAFSKQFSYSKYYLEQQFKREYGVSLIAYRNGKRMELAGGLLLRESVSKTAESLGFSSIYAFSRAFKNRYGISPLEYKKKMHAASLR